MAPFGNDPQSNPGALQFTQSLTNAISLHHVFEHKPLALSGSQRFMRILHRIRILLKQCRQGFLRIGTPRRKHLQFIGISTVLDHGMLGAPQRQDVPTPQHHILLLVFAELSQHLVLCDEQITHALTIRHRKSKIIIVNRKTLRGQSLPHIDDECLFFFVRCAFPNMIHEQMRSKRIH